MTIQDEDTATGETPVGVAERILEMRRAFDDTFAAPRRALEADVEKIVILKVGSLRIACRVGQITRLETDRKIVPLSGGAPGLIGLAGIRGKLVPVYSLALLLGAGAGAATRWLALAGGDDPIALAFDGLDQFVRAHRQDVCPAEGAQAAGRHVKEVLRQGSASCGLLDVDSVLAHVRAQAAGEAGRGHA